MVTAAPAPDRRESFTAAMAFERALDIDVRQVTPEATRAMLQAQDRLPSALGLHPNAARRWLEGPAGGGLARDAVARLPQHGHRWPRALDAAIAAAAARQAEGAA